MSDKEKSHYLYSAMTIVNGSEKKEISIEEDSDSLKIRISASEIESVTMTVHEGLTMLHVLEKWKGSLLDNPLYADQVKSWESARDKKEVLRKLVSDLVSNFLHHSGDDLESGEITSGEIANCLKTELDRVINGE